MASVASIQPLFPEDRVLGELIDTAGALISECQKLARLDDKPLAAALVPMLRSMNSYYTNKIEGHHTTPAKIEAALRKEFLPDTGERQKQLLATAHIEAETTLEQHWQGTPVQALFSMEKVREIHERLFSVLPAAFRVTQEGEPIVPGALRTRNVTVGQHLAPEAGIIEDLVNTWAARYGREKLKEHQLIGIACSHHRLAWIHPFIDGNGRVSRLHSHLALHAAGMTRGVWSPLRGMARSHETYYERLAAADMSRRNDLDGRGNLSQEELVNFARYFIVDCCLDQVTYMTQMTDMGGFARRLSDLLRFLENNPWQIGSEKSVVKAELAALPMEFVAANRPLARGEFAQMLRTSDSTARRIIRSLLDVGLLKSASHRDELSFALPLASLRMLFPKLWPEADTSPVHHERERTLEQPAPSHVPARHKQ